MATTNGCNGNGGDDGSNGGGGRSGSGSHHSTKPRKENSRTKRRNALIAEIIANMSIPPFRIEQPRVLPTQMGSAGAGSSHVSGPSDVSGVEPVKVTCVEPPRGAPFRVVEFPKVERSEGPKVDPPPQTVEQVPPRQLPPQPAVNVVGGGEQVEKPDVDMDEVIPAEDGQAVVLSIIVRSYTFGDVGVMYNIRTDETFEAFYKDYASRIDVNTNQIKLYLGATYVPATEYLKVVGVETGTVLYVQGEEGVVNTCTRFKRFYLKNTGHRRKIKLRVQGKLDTSLCRLFHIWGDKVNVDPTDLVFYHEDILLCTLNTIREAKIKNGDKVIVAPYGKP